MFTPVFKRSVWAAAIVIVGTACSSNGATMDEATVRAYHDALERHPGAASGVDEGVATFRRTYGDLAEENFAERVAELYAEELYFNDTIHIIRDRDELVEYMRKTGAGLESSSVEIERVIRDGEDVYVRWTMHFVTRAAGKRIDSHSIGISQLRFNDQGKIVFHQDFWDSASALYQHLPVVGFFVRRARGAMQ
jgi:hypothetical protein